MKLLAWIGDAIWVYLIPLLIVSSVLGMGPGEWFIVALDMVGIVFLMFLLIFLLWLIRVPSRAIERRSGTPDLDK